MKPKPLLVLLALAAMLAPAASCRCSDSAKEQPDGGAQASRSDAGDAGAEVLAGQSFKLANGLQVELVSGPCGDSAALAVLLGVGIDHEPPGRSGMAHLAERLLASSAAAGRAKRTVETGNGYTLYTVVAAGEGLLAELSDVAAWLNQAPAEADLERARAAVQKELSQLQGADAARTALSYAEESVLPTRGNGKRLGIAAEVEAITLAELQAFWQAHFKPGNARFAVAGRFDADKVRARIEAVLAPLPAGTSPVVREATDATVRGTLVMGDAPTAVAVAVPAPALSGPLYPAFLILAARLLGEAAEPHSWQVSYDPIRRPELLSITGAVGPAEQPEPAASRIRSEVGTILEPPLAPGDITGAKERFRLLLEPKLLDPAICAKDPRTFAAARVRRAQLEGAPLAPALDQVSEQQLAEARKLFEPQRTAAVIAGGTIR